MDYRYLFLTLGIPWTQSMPSRDVNAATRLAEASWRRDNDINIMFKVYVLRNIFTKAIHKNDIFMNMNLYLFYTTK